MDNSKLESNLIMYEILVMRMQRNFSLISTRLPLNGCFRIIAQGERFYKACLGLATDNRQQSDIITVKIALGSMQTNAKVNAKLNLFHKRLCNNFLSIYSHSPVANKMFIYIQTQIFPHSIELRFT